MKNATTIRTPPTIGTQKASRRTMSSTIDAHHGDRQDDPREHGGDRHADADQRGVAVAHAANAHRLREVEPEHRHDEGETGVGDEEDAGEEDVPDADGALGKFPRCAGQRDPQLSADLARSRDHRRGRREAARRKPRAVAGSSPTPLRRGFKTTSPRSFFRYPDLGFECRRGSAEWSHDQPGRAARRPPRARRARGRTILLAERFAALRVGLRAGRFGSASPATSFGSSRRCSSMASPSSRSGRGLSPGTNG